MKIDTDKLEEFCRLNDFILIDDKELQKENMYKNFVYATDDNFLGIRVYPIDMPLIINNGVWDKLKKVNKELKKDNKCLTIYDAYRPIAVQKMFWDCFYKTHGYYDETLVANPSKYGTHNIKINAVDLFITNIDGSDIELPCKFDDFTGKASINYNECSREAKRNRDLLINTCSKYGLIVHDDEWWHFYDERLKDQGMKYIYSESDLVPKMEKEVFVLEK